MAVATLTPIPELVEKVQRYFPQADVDLLERAYMFAQRAHGDQKRVSGEPYVAHPYAAAMILAEIQLDLPSICAALLHDVPEDTDVTL